MNPEFCVCHTCRIVLKVSECIPDFGNHDGWELPPSTHHYCPECESDPIDDYFYSQDEAEKSLTNKAGHND